MKEAAILTAVRDLEVRTLSAIPGALARLVYLASTRDYNTGQYWHDGLAQRFTPEVAQAALQRCHVSVFRDLAEQGIEAIVEEIGSYFAASHEDPGQILKTWRGLEPYRILIPAACDGAIRDLFLSNFTLALQIVYSQTKPRSQLAGQQPR